jgi:hypothetical protein
MTNLPSGLASDTNLATGPADSADAKQLSEPRISPRGRRNAASGNHPKMPDRVPHD